MKSQNCRRRGNFFNNHHRHCCPGGDNRPDARAGRPGVADHQLGDQHGEEGLAEPGHPPPQGDAGGADQRKCTVRCVRIIRMRGSHCFTNITKSTPRACRPAIKLDQYSKTILFVHARCIGDFQRREISFPNQTNKFQLVAHHGSYQTWIHLSYDRWSNSFSWSSREKMNPIRSISSPKKWRQ